MNMNTLTAAAIAATCALCGCLTVPTEIERRAAQRAAAYDEFTPDQQERTLLGHIQIGDPTNMLWMVLGDPARIGETPHPAALVEGVDTADSAAEWMLETWTYVREPDPRTVGAQPPPIGFQPGAMFVANPPPPPVRVTKTYVIAGGVIVDMKTENSTDNN